jgi:fructose-bisphosphate aldolase, class II
MQTLRSVLEDTDRARVGIGHFNVSDLVALNAVVSAAREVGVPVIVGVSESEREFMGVRGVSALVRAVREESGHPVFLNADHTHTLEKAEEAARAGFDSIVFDGSALPFDENVRETARAVEAVRSIADSMVVEGEVGFIGSGSEIHDTAPDAARILTTPDEAKQFVAATRVDVLAPAVGNMHGMVREMVRGEAEKHLDIARIAAIKQAVHLPMTLHGGSGTKSDDLRQAVKAGMTIVHINTELRLAWRRGVEAGLAAHPEEVAPYKILPRAVQAVHDVVRDRLRLFNAR